jgi:hypothetical protein
MCTVLLQNATNTSIPNYEYMDVRDVFKVIPGCTYKIVVESNPHDGKKNASLMYTVPGKVNTRIITYVRVCTVFRVQADWTFILPSELPAKELRHLPRKMPQRGTT